VWGQKINEKNAWHMNLLDHMRGLAAAQETDFVTAGESVIFCCLIEICVYQKVRREQMQVSSKHGNKHR
jgi:hypothetical protein